MDLKNANERNVHRFIDALSEVLVLGDLMHVDMREAVAAYIASDDFSDDEEAVNVIAAVVRYLMEGK